MYVMVTSVFSVYNLVFSVDDLRSILLSVVHSRIHSFMTLIAASNNSSLYSVPPMEICLSHLYIILFLLNWWIQLRTGLFCHWMISCNTILEEKYDLCIKIVWSDLFHYIPKCINASFWNHHILYFEPIML